MTQAPSQPTPTPGDEPTQTQPAASPDAAAAPGNVVIKCMGLTKVFKDFWLRDKARAVDGIDLEIRRGEVFGLLGPNGAGKSTTIKMILGLLHPTAGRIAVFNKVPRDVATKKVIGYLPEETYLYKFLNPTETLDYYGKLFGLDRTTRKKRIDMLLEMVGLDHVARRPVGEFSKGMMRKVGLAQALINDPKLLILDEPTSGMDPIATADVKKVITRLADRGKTVLLCSHLLADVQEVCDRVAMMYGGKVRRAGTMDTLLTDENQTTITTPSLDSVSDERIVAALEALGVSDVSVDHPRRTLEQVFLDMVAEAQQQKIKSDGAVSGRDVADFLQSGEDDDAPATSERLIESLVSGEPDRPAAADPTPEPPEPTAPAPAPAQPALDDVLSDLDLTKPKPAPTPAAPARNTAKPPKPAPPAADTPADKKKTGDGGGSVIDDLLNG